MKKIIVTGSIQLLDSSITAVMVREMLSKLGSADFSCTEIDQVDMTGMDLPRHVWVYVSNDDTLPPLLVSGPRDQDGTQLEGSELSKMQAEGVCVEFFAQYPRADHYGAPGYAAEDFLAEVAIAEQGFRVPYEGLDVTADDRGDDGSEEIWLKIALPA